MEPAAESTEVCPMQMGDVPVMMATGGALILMVTGADGGLPQPLVILTV